MSTNVKGSRDFDNMPTVDGSRIVPAGGAQNDVLTKQSAADYDYDWAAGGGGGGLGGGSFHFYADQVEYPVGSNWNVNVGAPAMPDSNNAALKVRRFDDAADEAIGFMVKVPASATSLTVRTKARAETAPGATQNAIMALHKRSAGDNAAVSSWSTNALTTIALPTNENFQYDETVDTLANWGLTAGVTYQMQISRDANNAGDTLVGDLALLVTELEFS